MDAPRIVPADLEAAIKSEHYFTAEDGVAGAMAAQQNTGDMRDARAALKLLTICVLVLHNGFTVLGKSACASPENFDAEIGKKVARQDALNQLWPLLGYELKTTLHRRAQFGQSD